MAIDKYDGYEVLAKLLYPSIEASGNVYYGQTRKLTTDNTFGKNELNFDSHIETFKVNGNYESYFNWKIGPLSGAVRIEPLSKESDDSLGDYTTANFPGSGVYEVSLDGYSEEITDSSYVLHGVMFAKYKLNFIDKEVSNNLYSGNFNTYENFVSCNFEYITVRNYRFMDNYDPYTRSFYIEKEGLYWYLYIQVAFDSTNHITQHELETPFTIKSTGGITEVVLDNIDSYESSTDGGSSWTALSIDDSLYVLDGGTLSLRVKSGSLVSSPKVIIDKAPLQHNAVTEIYGNIHSLKFSDYSSSTYYDISSYSNIFENLFTPTGNTCNIVDASKLILPANILSDSCYIGMFKDCASLKIAPELCATELAQHCYEEMFNGCVDLKGVLELPATTLADYCYSYMFDGCTSLINAPKLPATVLAEGCYSGMFDGCASLINAPKLPATTLAEGCYSAMFYECTSLINAPKLLATTLADYCYSGMFYGCTSLINAPKLPATVLAEGCYNSMFGRCSMLSGVAVAATWDVNTYTDNWLQNAGTNSATKTIWCDTTYTDYPTNDSGIPSSWNKQPYSNYIEPSVNSLEDLSETDYKGFCDRLAITRNNRKVPFVVSSGSDSEFNGRGLLNNSTKFNMEGSFDENNTHQTDTYNSDGSYNQELWGYKSFNSPVKFRNGVYGECGSLVTSNESLRGFSQNGISLYSNTLHVGNDTSYKPHSAININSGYEYDFFVTLNTIYSTSNKDTCNAGYNYVVGDGIPDGPNFNNCASVYTISDNVTSGSLNRNISRLVSNFNNTTIGNPNEGTSSITVTSTKDSSDIITPDISLSVEYKYGLTDSTNLINIKHDKTEISKSIIPSSANINLGDTNYKFDNAYANKFHGDLNGIIPTPVYNNSTTITNGCIFLAKFINDTVSEYNVGEVITYTGASTTGIIITFAQSYYNSNVNELRWNGVGVVPNGDYKLLSSIKFDGDRSHDVIALVIKV